MERELPWISVPAADGLDGHPPWICGYVLIRYAGVIAGVVGQQKKGVRVQRRREPVPGNEA